MHDSQSLSEGGNNEIQDLMGTRIKNMDGLEKEILRLRLKQKDTEQQMERQWGKLKNHFGAMIINSFKRRKTEEEEPRSGFFESILHNEKVEEILHKVSDKISGKLSAALSSLLDKFFKK